MLVFIAGYQADNTIVYSVHDQVATLEMAKEINFGRNPARISYYW